MENPRIVLNRGAAIVALFAFTFPAQADPLTSEQLSKILKELESIEQVVEGKRLSTRSSAVEKFRSASSSDKAAYDFYLDCIKMLRFDERDARFSEFRDWRDKNEARLKQPGTMMAMRLQLQYLVMTLRVAEGVERELIIPELEKFVAGIVANADALEADGLKTLREGVNRTVFAEAYELNQSLQVSGWSFAPGDVGGVYQSTIFPFYRAERPELLSAAWDRRIDLEKRMTSLTREDDPIALKKFEEERLPRLYWDKAVDVFGSASQQEGAIAMIQLLRGNPDHPDAAKWLSNFKSLLIGPAPMEEDTGA